MVNCVSKHWWRLALCLMCFAVMVGDIIVVKYTSSYVIEIIGIFVVLGVCVGAILLLPCHLDERMWWHSHWRCYPNGGYTPPSDTVVVWV